MVSNTYFFVLSFCFIFLRLVNPMLPISLDCPLLPLRYSLMLVFILVDGARINEDAMIKYAAQVRMAVKCEDFRV